MKHAGILALKRTLPTASKSDSTSSTNESKSSDVECLWAHTTETMGVGYYSSSLPKPKVLLIVVGTDHFVDDRSNMFLF